MLNFSIGTTRSQRAFAPTKTLTTILIETRFVLRLRERVFGVTLIELSMAWR
jgi:hypothetical protein